MALNFEIPTLVKQLKKIKPKRVLVQLAEGIKQNATEISQPIGELGIEVIFSGETAWGGCALALEEAKSDLARYKEEGNSEKSDYYQKLIEKTWEILPLETRNKIKEGVLKRISRKVRA